MNIDADGISLRRPWIIPFVEVESTMDEARRLALSGCPSGTIVLADRQTAGRGRIPGRLWAAEPGSSLLMTLVLGGEAMAVATLPLRAGLALCALVEGIARGAGRDPGIFRLKWPNDLVALGVDAGPGEGVAAPGAAAPGAHKLAGILCEKAGGMFLVGLGLNLAGTAYPPDLAGKACSLEGALGVPAKALPGPEALAAGFAVQMAEALADREWKRKVESRLWGIGENVRFLEGHPDGGRIEEGRIEGIDGEGRLLLALRDGTRTFSSGEVGGFQPAAPFEG